jgi:F420-0:gamma-glutamyl ligase
VPDDELAAAKTRYRRMLERFTPLSETVMMMASTGSAQRMREKRIREALGIELISVPVRDYFGLVDFLIDGAWITEEASADRSAVAAALGRFLDMEIVTRHGTSR